MPLTESRCSVSRYGLEEVYRRVRSQVSSLQRRCRLGLQCEALFAAISEELQQLPISTEGYGRAAFHLASAVRYIDCRESGAACYELRLLQRGLIVGST